MTLDRFNQLTAAATEEALLACCASPGWAQQVSDGRPYGDRQALLDAGDDAFAALSSDAIDAAVAAHPRIGERPDAAQPPGRQAQEAAWSRQEQSAAQATADVQAELATTNAAYEAKFGQVFLICASGRQATEILAEARRRLGNDPATERTELVRELGAIVALRLAKLVPR